MKHLLVLLYALSTSVILSATDYEKEPCRGQVLDAQTGDPVEYVSIGIAGKNLGTVSTDDGIYSLMIDPRYDGDTIKFSSIGYNNLAIPITELKKQNDRDIIMSPCDIALREVFVDPVKLKAKTLGNNYKGDKINAGFHTNRKGYEVGVLLNIDKPTFLEEFAFNMVKCSYSKLFYRLNIYRQTEDGKFENILNEPIYIDKKIDESSPIISISLAEYNITVDHNTLITIEHIKDMGEGWLTFSARQNIGKGATCFYRTTSQGNWAKSPYKLAFSVKVKEEQTSDKHNTFAMSEL